MVGIALASKTRYPMSKDGSPGLFASCSDFVCATLNPRPKLKGQQVVGPDANAPSAHTAKAPISATTSEIVLMRKELPPPNCAPLNTSQHGKSINRERFVKTCDSQPSIRAMIAHSSRSRSRVSDAITIRLTRLIPLNRKRGVAQPGQSTAFGTQESLVQIQSPRPFFFHDD
jgi:hypothetical protein